MGDIPMIAEEKNAHLIKCADGNYIDLSNVGLNEIGSTLPKNITAVANERYEP